MVGSLNSKDLKERAEEYRTWSENGVSDAMKELFRKRAEELEDMARVMEEIEGLRLNMLNKFGVSLT